jgi:hypothetical protein
MPYSLLLVVSTVNGLKKTPAASTDGSCESWQISATQQFATFQEPEKIHKCSLPNYSQASLNKRDMF